MLRYVLIAIIIYLIYSIVKAFIGRKNIKNRSVKTNKYDEREITDAEFREVKPDEDVKEN
ncbi:MAG: hypothetical protein N2510_03825 [Ignavibacteria bacterium]|nr:hypothetical protein [Ignavibacteria bacterium]